MRSMLLTILASVALVGAACATPAQAKGHGGPKAGKPMPVPGSGMRRGGGHARRMARKLGLSGAAMQQMVQFHQAHKAKMGPLKLTKALKKAEMKVLWLQPKPSRKAIVAKQKELLKVKGQLMAEKADFQLKVVALLNPGQRLKFMTMMKDHHGNKGGKHGGKMGRGGHGKGGHGGKSGRGRRGGGGMIL